jgi:hypothetical protein
MSHGRRRKLLRDRGGKLGGSFRDPFIISSLKRFGFQNLPSHTYGEDSGFKIFG